MTACCVEDYAHVGLPTDCAAVLLMETDGHPAVVADEAAQMEALARDARRPRSARGARRGRGAAAGRRRGATRSPRWRAGGRRRSSKTSPCRAASWRRWSRFIAETAAAFNLQIGTFGHMGDGNLHPTFLADERDADEMHRVHQALEAIVEADARARRHDHRRARRRAGEEAVAAPADGRRQLRADAPDQADARSARPAQSRQDVRLIDAGDPRDHRLLGPAAVHALRHVPADLPDLRRDRARAEQPARPHRADAGDRRRRARGLARRSPTR